MSRQVRTTPAGEEIVFKPSRSIRVWHTITNIVFLVIVGAATFWTLPSVRIFFQTGEMTGATKLLERFDLSDRWIFTLITGWCVILVWWGLGAIYEILKIHIQNDRFLLRADALVVRRRKILAKELQFKSYEPLELRLRPLDGALEAKNKVGSHVLTEAGTTDDRDWLMDTLQKRYRFPDVSVGTSTFETVATFRVERRPDESVFITSSAASRMGCGVLASIACLSLLSTSVWLFMKGSGAAFIVLLFFVAFAYAGLTALNRRFIEASRGRIFVRWSSPVGSILKRFISPDHMLLRYQFSDGEYERNAGVLTLKSVVRKKQEPTYHIVIRHNNSDNQFVDPRENGLEEDTRIAEDVVLTISGISSRPAAEYMLHLLIETTGFPRSDGGLASERTN